MIRPGTFVFRTLSAMARQRKELSDAHCGAVTELLHTSFIVQRALQGQLEKTGLTDLKFAVLVALYALDPNPVTTTDLAFYTGCTRSAVTKAVATLYARKLLATARDDADGRVKYLRLTPPGRRLSEITALAYLGSIGQMARALHTPALFTLRRACSRLAEGAIRVSTAPPFSP